jgi:hypothetical protein
MSRKRNSFPAVYETMMITTIDIRIIWEKGARIALLRPVTAEGRYWLSDNVKGRGVNSDAVCEVEKLLALINRIQKAKLVVRWQQS